MNALDQLAAEARRQCEIIGHNHDWVPAPQEGAYNVLIIGGGQAGLGSAFALQRERIGHVKVIDANTADHVGCWAEYARMHTLRSPKNMKGIELDIPALHPQSWFEAKYGAKAWEETRLIPRLDWNEYLSWYRETTGVDVDHGVTATAVHKPDSDGLFTVETTNGEYKARRIIFSLGLDGGGGAFVPPMIKDLPDHLWAHTEDPIDFSALKGKHVAVLGGGASGFDNAATALDNGAASATVYMRRGDVPVENSLRWMEFPGMQEHFYDLTDEEKWEFGVFNGGLPQPPTQHTIWRCFDKDNFELRRNSPWTSVTIDGEGVLINGEDHADFIISATGYAVDLSLRPELKEFYDDIALWSDKFPTEGHPLGNCPYLGPGFQFTPKEGSDADYLSRLIHFSTGARASMGVCGNQLSGIYAGLTRIGWNMSADITKENWAQFMDDFRNFHHVEVRNVGPSTDTYPQGPRYGATGK